MATITAKDVNELRQQTGLGMMECKQALAETGGDKQAAMDLLRQRGLAKMDARADRASAEGRVAAAVAPDKSRAAIVEVNSETDFTAKNDAFVAMAQKIADEALGQPPGAVQKNDAIQRLIDNVRITTKENVQFARGQVVGGPGRKIGSYVHHNGRTGVLVEVETGGKDVPDELLKDLCFHITAAVPVPIGVTEGDIPAEVIEKEKQIAKAQAIEQGKPEPIAVKMVEGKVRKFYEDHVLLHQVSVRHLDQKKKIKDLLPAGVTVKSFVRYQLGQR